MRTMKVVLVVLCFSLSACATGGRIFVGFDRTDERHYVESAKQQPLICLFTDCSKSEAK